MITSADAARRPSHVLVVDDIPGVRAALCVHLEYQGYRVTTAADGLAALEQISNALPDAVVLSAAIPLLDGLAVLRRLRGAGPHLPVLMLTAPASAESRITALNAGADDAMAKPVDLGPPRRRGGP